MEQFLSELIEGIDGKIQGDPDKVIKGLAPFDEAGIDDLTFADTPKILKRIKETNAGAVIVPKNFDQEVSTNLIRSDRPRLAFAKIMHRCFPRDCPPENISSSASVGKGVVFGKEVSLGALSVIEDDAVIGNRVIIHPHVVVGREVTIGDDVTIYPNVTILDRCVIGNRVIIHSGTVIGSDGFGFVPDKEKHYKIPQTGIVQVDDDVEIGACNTIDRATFGKTWIKKGVKTDNHVQIGHNVVIGENTLIVAQVGIAGSTQIGKNVILAGQAGIAGHISIGDYAVVGPQAGVTRSVPSGQVVSGTPEMPHQLWLRISRMIPRLPELKKKMSDLEKRLNEISNS